MTGRHIHDILEEIVSVKDLEVERLKVQMPLDRLEERIDRQPRPLNLAGALMGDGVRMIAELKQASPSAGVLRADYDPASIAQAYADNGAAAVSVLTNADHFGGSLQHLEAVSGAVGYRGIPVLRKEFIFDEYQVYEARAYGADAILLIVAILTAQTLEGLMKLAQRFWMQCLVEVHNEGELRIALNAGAEIIGVNNRDLRTFVTDLAITERLAPRVPIGKIVVSESGIRTREDVECAGRAGASAVLVGEALMAAPDPGAKLRELV